MNVKISQDQMDRIILKWITKSVGKLTTDNKYYHYERFSCKFWVNDKGIKVVREMYQSDPIKLNNVKPYYINSGIYYELMDNIEALFNIDKYQSVSYIMKWVDLQIGNKGVKLGVFFG